ncbi:hypothetical protein KW460_15615 [Vibrio fluvialis]|nr:hypothetical protein [Vibrio fluvialis]MBY7872754.1 hypothetical protein [Vibrio fluvialis]
MRQTILRFNSLNLKNLPQDIRQHHALPVNSATIVRGLCVEKRNAGTRSLFHSALIKVMRQAERASLIKKLTQDPEWGNEAKMTPFLESTPHFFRTPLTQPNF